MMLHYEWSIPSGGSLLFVMIWRGVGLAGGGLMILLAPL